MKLIRFLYDDKTLTGELKGDQILVNSNSSESREIPFSKVVLLAPVVPSKIIAVGLNYKLHAKELDMAIPSEPIIFLKPETAIVGHHQSIIYPEMSKEVDYEAELAVVIGMTAKNIEKEQAFKYIMGYTCFNDVTARDLQRKDGQWTRAKSFDTFAPLGPWIETALNPEKTGIRSYLNGKIKQDSNTSDMIFSVSELVSYISKIMTLFPGDVIATGTPEGIGPMIPGDIVEIEIDGIGKLTNKVV